MWIISCSVINYDCILLKKVEKSPVCFKFLFLVLGQAYNDNITLLDFWIKILIFDIMKFDIVSFIL